MEQTYDDLTQNLKFENENSEMDIEGTVIKVDLKPPLTEIQKLPNERKENSNQEKHIVEIKNENHEHGQNEQSQDALSLKETLDITLENKEIRSYNCGKSFNSEENPSALKESSTKTSKVKEQMYGSKGV